MQALDALGVELRFAARRIRRAPRLTSAIVLTLGVGIGANAAMFEIVDRLFLRAPAYLNEAARVQRVYQQRVASGRTSYDGSLSYPAYREIKRNAAPLMTVTGHASGQMIVAIGESPRQLPVSLVDAAFWSLFSAKPVIGRFFAADEDERSSASPPVVLSHALWQTEFGGRRDVLGRPLRIEATSYDIVGVAPPGFTGLGHRRVAAFVPIAAAGADLAGQGFASDPGTTFIELAVRTHPEMLSEAAATGIDRAFHASLVATRGEVEARRLSSWRAVLAPLSTERGPRPSEAGRISIWLLGMSAIVLLIACANVANLLLARALRQRGAAAIDAALGIGAPRLVVRVLAENILLSLLAGAVAVPLAYWCTSRIGGLLAPAVMEVGPALDLRTIGFALALVTITGVLTGILPAIQARRTEPAAVLRGATMVGGGRSSWAHSALLVAQATLSTLLLIGAGLFLRSVQHARNLELGYDPADVLLVTTQAPDAEGALFRFSSEDSAAERLIRQLHRLASQDPGIRHAALALTIPFFRNSFRPVFLPGQDSVPHSGRYAMNVVSPDYFAALGTRLMRGRAFRDSDDGSSPPVVIVSQTMAQTLWPAGEALGQCVALIDRALPCRTVIGIARDIRRGDLRDDLMLQFYLPDAQYDRGFPGILVLRTVADAASVAEPIRRALQSAASGMVYVDVQRLEDHVLEQMRSWSVGAAVLTVLGAIALLLATFGLFSVVAYDMARRRREFGVRVALGARPANLMLVALRHHAELAIGGIALGLSLGFLAVRLLEERLFRVPPHDPLTFAAVAVVLLLAAALASVAPAWRATRAQPGEVLRTDLG
jgi:predicted permease